MAVYSLEKRYFKTESRKSWRSSFYFTLGAALPGAAVLVWLFSYMSFDRLKQYISYIFLDTSHGIYTMEE